MDVWIARGGEIITECPRADLDGYARNGHLQPHDHYWHEGMTEWRQLDELLGRAVWLSESAKPQPGLTPAVSHPQAPEHSAKAWSAAGEIERSTAQQPEKLVWMRTPARWWANQTIRYSAIASGALLLTALVLSIAFRPAPKPPDIRVAYDPAKDTALRDRATADLSARLSNLPPTSPTDASNVRYRDLRVSLAPTESVTAPWRATVEGSEDILDPTSREAVWKTDFLLVVEYEGTHWVFRRYKAITTHVADGRTELIDHAAGVGVPPTVAAMLKIVMP